LCICTQKSFRSQKRYSGLSRAEVLRECYV
jgi:hypothetical protein